MERKRFINFRFSDFASGVWIAITVRFLGMFAFAIYGPFFLLYLNQTRGLTMTVAGTVVAIASLSGAVSQALGGMVTDRFGRRNTLIFFSAMDILVNIALTVSIAYTAPLWSIAFVYVVGSFLSGMKSPVTTSIIVDLAPRERLTEAYGIALQVLAGRVVNRWNARTKNPAAVLVRMFPVCLGLAADGFETIASLSLAEAVAPLIDPSR